MSDARRPIWPAERPAAPRARILDRGYRPYRGPRTGVRGAVVTVWRQSVQRALGIRRSAWAKILPLAAVGISYVPAIVFIGIVALIPEENLDAGFELPTFGEYFRFIQAAVLLFVAVRRPRDPLHRPPHRDARHLPGLAAVAGQLPRRPRRVAAFSVISPHHHRPAAADAGRLRAPGRRARTGRAAWPRLVRPDPGRRGCCWRCSTPPSALGVSSLTDRKAFATAALLLLMVVVSSFIAVLVDEAGLPESLHGLSLLTGPFAWCELIYGETARHPGPGAAGRARRAGAAWTVARARRSPASATSSCR